MNKQQIQLELLSLGYNRQVSKAHTIFSSFWDIFFGISVGFLGLVLATKEVGLLELNVPIFILLIVLIFIIVGLVGIIAFIFWFISRAERKVIVNQIKLLAT